jgi:hypothetical protein
MLRGRAARTAGVPAAEGMLRTDQDCVPEHNANVLRAGDALTCALSALQWVTADSTS